MFNLVLPLNGGAVRRRNMKVFVIDKYNKPLMPCSERKARLLLKEHKAKIIKYRPFAIKLTYGSSKYVQDTTLGVDTGYKHIGIAATSGDHVLVSGEVELRYDIPKLLIKRRELRRSRRNRTTRYRPKRLLNRVASKKKGWLPPSVCNKLNHTYNWINTFRGLLPSPVLRIEVGKFDMQKLENPDIEGTGYQQGTLYGYRNLVAYLLAREQGVCQYCGKRHISGDGWRTHHIWGKLSGRNRPDHFALLHSTCHDALHAKHEEDILRTKKIKSYKDSTFMNILRSRIYSTYPEAEFTTGHITYQDRCDLNLDKSYAHDAIAITKIPHIMSGMKDRFYIKQVRKKKRSLHEAKPRKGRKTKNITQKRNIKNVKSVKGVHLNDMIKYNGELGYVSGFSGSSSVYVKRLVGMGYITSPTTKGISTPISKISVTCHNNNWLYTTIPDLQIDSIQGTK
jgi:hypothetical protein